MNFHERQWMYAALQHSAAVGMGFIPVLLTADKIQSKYPAAAREGMKPSPTVTECCHHEDNPLIANVLRTSAVGMGFIPVLLTADKIQSKYPAAAREGMKPSPTVDVYCYRVDNSLIAIVLHTSAVGMGFIPVLPTADKIQSKYPAAAREGMKPSPTVAECCNHFNNPLITNMLHISSVGAGFIPALPTADKIQSKYPAAARVEINGSYISNNSLIL
ncbi:MAG: hypothetical protein SPM31_05655 [Prevotella sp.]|nr:hypothetical protein [Prevotella sp.]